MKWRLVKQAELICKCLFLHGQKSEKSIRAICIHWLEPVEWRRIEINGITVCVELSQVPGAFAM